MKKKLCSIVVIFAFIPATAKAHCPLCTAGAGALALGAAYMGVSTYVIGIFIGAFALALALWIPRLIKKEYIPYQKPMLIILIFLSTIIPLLPLLQHYVSFNIYWFGDYGSLFNKTYMVNRFLVGSVIGASIMFISPYMSKRLSTMRAGKLFPYQGMMITFILLIISSLLMQFAFSM